MFRAPERNAASTTTVPPARGGDQPVTGQEAHPRRVGARRQLRHQEVPGGESVEDALVPRRIAHVDPVGQHPDARSADRQCPPMGGRVDPERPAGDDGHPLLGEVGGEVAGHPVAVRGGSAGADDRHRALHQHRKVTGAAQPQPVRHPAPALDRVQTGQVLQPVRPLLLPRNHKPRILRPDPAVQLLDVGGRGPTGGGLPQRAFADGGPGALGTQLADQLGHGRVAAVHGGAEGKASGPFQVGHHPASRLTVPGCSPRRIARAKATSSALGRSRSARSATVHAIRNTLSTPRALSRPRRNASSTTRSPSGSGRCRRRCDPGTSPLVCHPLPASRCRWRSRALLHPLRHSRGGFAALPHRRLQMGPPHRQEGLGDVDPVADGT